MSSCPLKLPNNAFFGFNVMKSIDVTISGNFYWFCFHEYKAFLREVFNEDIRS